MKNGTKCLLFIFLEKIKETGQVLNSVHLNKHEKKRTLKTDEGPKSQMTTELS